MPCRNASSCKGGSFNLVIERLLISGLLHLPDGAVRGVQCFNLVIERLLISGITSWRCVCVSSNCFNLVIERLLISGCRAGLPSIGILRFNLVIERLLISGKSDNFSSPPRLQFQSRYRAASHFRFVGAAPQRVANLFQSRYRAASHFRNSSPIFVQSYSVVSISLSSGFSFQVQSDLPRDKRPLKSFNLVIERLLISG